MLAKVRSSTISGLEATPVDVEIEVRGKLPRFNIIGLGDSAIRESRDRIVSAIKHSGFLMPKQVLVNLAPAELKKEGSAFDLAIALGVLVASGQVRLPDVQNSLVHGELALDGRVRPIKGSVALAVLACKEKVKQIIVPQSNVREASLIEGVKVVGIAHLSELIMYLQGKYTPNAMPQQSNLEQAGKASAKISEVWGQEQAKRALLIAAAGAHNVLMIGPPGCGKSMLAERLPSILPRLTQREMLESVQIHSIVGQDIQLLLSGERPFRSPHHVVSEVALVGGGPGPRPGEISLAHNGVLFLDEFPEYRRSALEALRTPMESGYASITRARASLKFPSRFQLIAAMNPCPCGRLGTDSCRCSRGAILAYLSKLSGPVLDRIDLHVDLKPVPIDILTARNHKTDLNADSEMLAKVNYAREVQFERQGKLNRDLKSEELRTFALSNSRAHTLLSSALKQNLISARGYTRILKIARSVADIEGLAEVKEEHIAEALNFRALERIENYCVA